MNDEQDIVLEPEEGKKKKSSTDSENTTSEDIELEDTSLDQQVKKLREKLRVAVEEKQSYLDGWQRERASVVNLRKKDEEAKQQFLKFADEDFIMDLMPVLDSFTMARANKEAWEKVDKNWRSGIEYIHSQLLSVLEKHNVTITDPLGQTYDPALHEAVEVIDPTEGQKPNTIVEVLQKGYTLHDKIIRAPKVKITK